MRTKLVFNVYGSTYIDIKRRAEQVIKDFLEIRENSIELSNVVDVQIDVEAKTEEPLTFVGHVFCKVKI